MRRSTTRPARGFTLVEMIATVTIMGIIGAVVLPVVDSAGSLYAESTSATRSVERVAFAIDRVSRILREIPLNEAEDGLAIDAVESDMIEISGGTRIERDGDQLVMTISGRSAPLCEGVQEFEIRALGADGLARTESSPGQTCRICVRLVVGGLESRTAVFPRSAMGVRR